MDQQEEDHGPQRSEQDAGDQQQQQQQQQQETSDRTMREEAFQDEHNNSNSEQFAATSAAQHVLNSIIIDDKAEERQIRNQTRRPRKITSDPMSYTTVNNNSPPPTNPLFHSETSPITRNRVVQFCAVSPRRRRQGDGERNSDAAADVNLLHLAAERSRGIYRDTAHRASDRVEGEPPADLLRGSAQDPVQEKLRHMGQTHSTRRSDEETKANTLPAPPASPTPTAAADNDDDVVPGAYQAAPGMRIQRTPDFHTGVLRHPMDGDFAHSTRSSATAVPSIVIGGGLDFSNNTNTTRLTSTNPVDYTSSGDVVSAVRVDEDDLELHIRDEICNTAAQAQVVDLEEETSQMVERRLVKVRKRYYAYATASMGIMSAIIVGLVLGVLRMTNDTDGERDVYIRSAPAPLTTLETIRKRGYLVCGGSVRDDAVTFEASYYEGMVQFNEGFCTAIAAAVLDGQPNVTFMKVAEQERWQALENGTLDLLLVGTPGTRESLHWNLDPSLPVQFSTPYLFDGVGVGGMPDYVNNCASNNGFQNFANCVDLKVCVVSGSKASEVAEERLHPSQIVPVASTNDLYTKFADRCCNVIATDYSNERAETMVKDMSGYEDAYAVGSVLFSPQPYAIATRKLPWTYEHATEETRMQDPHVWSEFVNWIIHALIAAEEYDITQATADLFQQTDAFGVEYKDMFRHALKQVGNYGELYARAREATVPRAGMNMINNGTTGLHYSQSLGNLADFGPPPYENGTISNIMSRGKLRCGLAMPQAINASDYRPMDFGPTEMGEMMEELMSPSPPDVIMGTANIDIAYCRALASAVFQGRLSIDDLTCSVNTHEFSKDRVHLSKPSFDLVILLDEADGYAQLDAGHIDVIVGYKQNLRGDVWEETTGEGFTFTQPYFFGPTEGQVTGANRCLATRQHDQQWSDFVQLTAMSLFYAEENGYTQSMANGMPVVNRFGSLFKRMMRDAVFSVGNYGEVYKSAVEPVYPREGTPNELNLHSTPQFASMPGLT